MKDYEIEYRIYELLRNGMRQGSAERTTLDKLNFHIFGADANSGTFDRLERITDDMLARGIIEANLTFSLAE